MQAIVEIAEQPWWQTYLWLTAIIGARYFLVASIPYFLFYRAGVPGFQKIDPRPPSHEQIRLEIRYSLLSILFFAAAAQTLLVFWVRGWAIIDVGIGPYGPWYLPLNFLLLVFFHDAYFYFTHRWLHRPEAFRRFHRIHHESRNPTPFAAFSFHPGEAFIEAFAIPLIALLIPSNLYVFFLFLLFMTVLGVTNHLGYELYPSGTARHWFGRWWIGAIHHQQHHTKYSSNFGLYFNFWDRLLKTQNPDYESQFDRVKADRPNSV